MEEKTVSQYKLNILIAITIFGLILVFTFDPIPQDTSYHLFADSYTFFSINNFWNVLSNLPIFIAGILGLNFTRRLNGKIFKEGFMLFFIGIALTGIGSLYYHFSPNNDTLVWDRLPMTIAFMSFLSIVISEYISMRAAKVLLYPLLLIGVLSVVYWIITESIGSGDLRLYILVQFLPLLLIPLILIFFRYQSNIGKYIWLILLTYAIAKIFEITDYQIYSFADIIGGHPLKHLAVSFSPFILIFAIKKKVDKN